MKIFNNSVLSGPIKFICGKLHGDNRPTKRAQNGCYGNAGCPESGPQNLHFMAAYFKNAKAYKLKSRAVYSARDLCHVTQYWGK